MCLDAMVVKVQGRVRLLAGLYMVKQKPLFKCDFRPVQHHLTQQKREHLL